MILVKNGRLVTGLKLLRSSGSKPGFSIMGVTWPSLRESGRDPEER